MQGTEGSISAGIAILISVPIKDIFLFVSIQSNLLMRNFVVV